MSIQISYLADHASWVSQVSEWYRDEWESLWTPNSFSGWFDVGMERASYSALPLAFVAHSNGELLGAAGLDQHAFAPELHHHRGPWLSGLFVVNGERKHDVQSMLVRQALETVSHFGHERLTTICRVRHERFNYSGKAWSTEETLVLSGRELQVLAIDLDGE